MEQIQVGDMQIEVVRSKRRTASLQVHSPDCRIVLRIPQRANPKTYLSFITQNTEKLKRQQARVARRVGVLDALESGCTLYFWGEEYVAEIVRGKSFSVVKGDGRALITLPQRAVDGRALLKKYYVEELRAAIEQKLPAWSEKLGLKVDEYKIMYMKSCWGRCHVNKRRIVFNAYLAQKPTQCLDYIIAHELTHLCVCNHGARFYSRLNSYYPNHKADEKLTQQARYLVL